MFCSVSLPLQYTGAFSDVVLVVVCQFRRYLCERSLIATIYRAEDADSIYVDHDTRIQILDTMSWLPHADREQCGAFIVSST